DVMKERNIDPSNDKVEQVTKRFQEMIQFIRLSNKIYISFVHGAAIGGGAGLALAADLVYAKEKTKFGWPYVQLGLGPDGGLTYELNRCLGRYKTLEAFVFGNSVTAKEIYDQNLIN